jgi:cytidylate kinase
MLSRDKTTSKRRSTNNRIIAIDGPAGSGKSTVAKAVAKRLGFLYMDTGAMYRALTWDAIRKKIDFSNAAAMVKLAKKIDIQLKMYQDSLQVRLDGKDISKAIRKQTLTGKVRYVAAIKGVRKEMVKLQRRLAKKAKGAVLEGRDIGTVVFPNARYKFYLDAQVSERIQRRFKELQQMGQKVKMDQIKKDLQERDRSDINRKIAPLVKAEDAVYIDTTNLSIEQVVKKILSNFFRFSRVSQNSFHL